MNHRGEERLILYYYGEDPNGAETEAHLAECDSCRTNYQALERVLGTMDALPVPERGEAYGDEVWRRVHRSVDIRRERFRWLAFAGIAAMLAIAFFAGRVSRQPMAGIPPAVRERILLVAVGEHFEKSQMVLLELVNARPDRTLNISAEQRRAGDLIGDNRLYRQAALRDGDTAAASVLDQLQRLLLDIAHDPSEISSTELGQLQHRIEADGILFKLRVAGRNTKSRERKF